MPMMSAPDRRATASAPTRRCAPSTSRRDGGADALHGAAPQRRALPDLQVTLNLPGAHNVLNALAAIAVAAELELPDAPMVKGARRIPRRRPPLPALRRSRAAAHGGGSFTLIDDYGHHPVEMAATLAAARGAFPGRRLVLAFQPHRYTRTRDCFEDFVKVLGSADAVLLDRGLSGRRGADRRRRRPRAGARAARRRQGRSGVRRRHRRDAAGDRRACARDGDVVISMGAGSIGDVPAQVVELAGARGRVHERDMDRPRHFGKVARADGRHLGRARDLADVRQRRARRAAVARASMRMRSIRPSASSPS